MELIDSDFVSFCKEREARQTAIKGSLTWETIIAIDPYFDDLLHGIKTIKPGEKFCANETWYKEYKPIILRRVGYFAPNYAPEILKTEKAYDVVYQKLYDALPDCKGCACMI
ncbi:MAG: hypothetical protein DYG83_10320 [Candidatus Brocadia sp. AMX2]|uniref:Uncharacterized protein n=1 Tax=Candidatus Brocadia sinica JPN1 TaxID=1197129 RepID=A0ABQ0JYF0_9BACT|nr:MULTISPECIES: hypothetical protein [Brocadia]MBC6932881.1 hypothetical protein [Candidatus Brocadia sp.]MBL1167633.1 hypothetical protein [Candidatus Brocadia sp. AMX1]NOG40475.1 hypothetical protein [Planctomycetota bacterium]NUO06273.1 hypothetical protein [Candidatus Brocadia sinica]KAA0242094.1 MAG: hypothetical protein EDM70_15720 [Candidatus Brocadia sp. AMX2]